MGASGWLIFVSLAMLSVASALLAPKPERSVVAVTEQMSASETTGDVVFRGSAEDMRALVFGQRLAVVHTAGLEAGRAGASGSVLFGSLGLPSGFVDAEGWKTTITGGRVISWATTQRGGYARMAAEAVNKAYGRPVAGVWASASSTVVFSDGTSLNLLGVSIGNGSTVAVSSL